MLKSLVALAILSAASAPALSQPADSAPAAAPAPTAQPATVKKRVCETVDEDPYSRLGNRRICRTIEVPAPSTGNQSGQKAPVSSERG